MTGIRAQLRRADEEDAGITLVEILVAMFIFALVSVGVVHSMLSVLTVTRDSRARQVAQNLAAEEIDRSRETADLFTLLSEDLPARTVNGDTFRIHREAQWVSDPGLDLECGSGGGALRYKRVNVTVTWDNMRPGSQPVRSDTLIDPNERINDPTKGTILVAVLNSTGGGVSGVGVTAAPGSPTGGAQPLAEAPDPTDAEGCSYILKVVPGNYVVTVSKAGHVDSDQNTTSSKSVSVSAGSAATVQFQYAAGTTTTLTYATNAPTPAVRVPVNLTATFLGGVDPYTSTVAGTPATSNQRVQRLHPLATGYEVFAGQCAAADPEGWPDGTDAAGAPITGKRVPAFETPIGGTAAVNVPMGLVQVSLGGTARQIRATPTVVASTGDPGCAPAASVVYEFGTGAQAPPGTGVIALPYGSWTLQHRPASGGTWTNVPASAMSVVNPTGRSGVTGTTVTLDPRTVVVP